MSKASHGLQLTLPERSAKPREFGLTNLVDNGYGVAELEDKLSWCHPFVDVIKFGWASSYISSNLGEKIALARKYDIRPCPGGMMFELCYLQGKATDYAHWLADNGFDLVEVSNGSLHIPETDKRRMIEFYAAKGLTVLSEVGSKDITMVSPRKNGPPSSMRNWKPAPGT